MKQGQSTGTFLWRIRTFPLSMLSLSMSKRLLVVLLSYGVGIPGLWFSFPRLNNAASMILPLICLCWLFSYRGLLISLVSTVGAIWLIYHYLSGDRLSPQMIVERTTLGLGIVLLLGLVICWLRAAIDLLHQAQKQALAAEHERILAQERERQVSIGYEQQRQINEMKDQFLLNVSHELRTPMTVLGGSLELLKDYSDMLEPVERQRVLTEALASQEALADLIKRVVDATTVVSDIPRPQPEATCVSHLLQEVVATLPPSDVEAYTICLDVPVQIIVWADPLLLRQVLHQVFSNIFKYVPKQTDIQIETTQATPSSPVCLSIQDAGPGIPLQELPLLFEKFVRLKRDLASSTPGMGLGLYICKRLVEAMKGRIWAESSGREGEGSRVCLTLPPFSSS